ncbi:MAG: hypothetical protein N2689_06220 [Verrucomicrobiae bacterium]|nr:hypothetical protein [Verrucomicrobiae bacterium]
MGTSSFADVLGGWFGVTPKLALSDGRTDTRQTPRATSYHFLTGSLVPTKNTVPGNYKIDDWWGSWSNTRFNNYSSWSYPGQGDGMRPSGEEPYDVEAIYFGNDSTNLYISIITSFAPPLGYLDTRANPGILVCSGDLALNFHSKGHNTPTASPDLFQYDYAVNINTEIRPASGNVTSSYDPAVQSPYGLYKTYNSDWYVGTPNNAVAAHGERTNCDPNWSSFSGVKVGDAQVTFRKLWFYSDGTSSWSQDPSKTEVKEGLADTYVLDVIIKQGDLRLATPLNPGDPISISWVEGCRNDANDSLGILRLHATFVPEPGMGCLLVVGGWLMGAVRRSRKHALPSTRHSTR